MAVTMSEVRGRLEREDVDYTAAATLGEAALPHLAELAAGEDTTLATKAVYLAGVIGGPGAVEIITAAAESGDPIVRIAAAVAMRTSHRCGG